MSMGAVSSQLDISESMRVVPCRWLVAWPAIAPRNNDNETTMRIPFLGNKAGPAVADQRPPASNNEEEEYSSEGQDLSRKSSAHTPAGSLRSMPSATKLSKEERSITKSKVYHLSGKGRTRERALLQGLGNNLTFLGRC